MVSVKTRLTFMSFMQFYVWGAWLITIGIYCGKTMGWTFPQFGAIFSTMGLSALFMPTITGIMADRWITRMAREHGMIEPFEDRQVRKGVISYGVSSYGYDMRVAREFRIFTNVLSSIVDPKNFDPKSFVEY